MPFPTPSHVVVTSLTAIVDAQARSFTVTRPTETTDSQTGDTIETTTTHAAQLAVFTPEEQPQQLRHGERISGSVTGLATAGTDIQFEDRIDYAGQTWEVTDVEGLPDEDDPELLALSFESYHGD